VTPAQARRARRTRQAQGITLDKRRRRFVGIQEDGFAVSLTRQVERHVAGVAAELAAEVRDRRGVTSFDSAERDEAARRAAVRASRANLSSDDR
jgi:hypothetical protein